MSQAVEHKKLETPIEREEWFLGLVDECRATIVEHEFHARWTVIEGWHAVGKRILQDEERFKQKGVDGEGAVSYMSHALGVSKRTIYRAIQFATKFPDLDRLPGGKDLSWYKVCNELLPEPREEKAKKTPEGEFDIVYADPPWGNGPDSDGAFGADRLAALKVPAAKDAVLFMWCPPSRMADAIKVLEAWGFQYRSHIAWLMGTERKDCQYVREIHECLVVARRGDIGAPKEQDRPYSFYSTDGLLKDQVRKYLEKMYPRGDRLGVFADQRKDWTTWQVSDDGKKGKADTAGDEKGGRGEE